MHSEQGVVGMMLFLFLVIAGIAFHSEVLWVYQFFMPGGLHWRRLTVALW